MVAQATERTVGAEVRAHITVRITLLGRAIVSVALAAVSLVLFVVAAVSLPLVVVWAGIPLSVAAAQATRPIADFHRRQAGRLLGREIGSPYLELAGRNLLIRWTSLLTDRATWRDLAWTAANGTAGLALSVVGVVEGVLDLLFWWLPPGTMIRVHAYLAAALLSPTKGTALAQRVQQLDRSRAETRDAAATELRRIERDLHDGAQARLVALGMSLGMAEDQVRTDPEAARALLKEARESSRLALAELRGLVRGIHPPVLSDRGLIGAIRALCLTAPFPVDVIGEIAGRLAPPVESAAYFAAAEAVTNAIRHSGATSAAVEIDERPGALHVTVTDNGRGGADPSWGSGLRGIERRLAAFDGTLFLSSPAGGPTTLAMVIPT